jgi:hypothetical protein
LSPQQPAAAQGQLRQRCRPRALLDFGRIGRAGLGLADSLPTSPQKLRASARRTEQCRAPQAAQQPLAPLGLRRLPVKKADDACELPACRGHLQHGCGGREGQQLAQAVVSSEDALAAVWHCFGDRCARCADKGQRWCDCANWACPETCAHLIRCRARGAAVQAVLRVHFVRVSRPLLTQCERAASSAHIVKSVRQPGQDIIRVRSAWGEMQAPLSRAKSSEFQCNLPIAHNQQVTVHTGTAVLLTY